MPHGGRATTGVIVARNFQTNRPRCRITANDEQKSRPRSFRMTRTAKQTVNSECVRENQSSIETINDPLVTVFPDAFASVPRERAPLSRVLNDIRSGRYAESVARLRELRRHDPAAYDEAKPRLPAFCISGIANTRKEPGQHSGLIQADLDKLGDGLGAMRDRLRTDPHIAFGFVSPSGQGLKLGVRIDGTRHAESFRAVESYFRDIYGAEIDRKCKDRLRLCFVSHDPEAWENPFAVPIPLALREFETVIKNSASPLHPAPTPYTLHSTPHTELIIASIAARASVIKAFDARGLGALFETLVEGRFPPMPEHRNEFITKAVPFLYRAVAPSVLLELVAGWYDCHYAMFDDSRQKHMSEAMAMLKSVTVTYAESLTTAERTIYEALPEIEQDAFRICRDLAMLESPGKEPLTFFLAADHLAIRLGTYPMKGFRVLKRIEGYQLITLLQKGTPRMAGSRATAGLYRWTLKGIKV